jgi:spectrin beta
LIKKHEAFEKSAAAQEERFSALERLTTFELKEMKRRQEAEENERLKIQIEAEAKAKEEQMRKQAEEMSKKQESTSFETDNSPAGSATLEGNLTRKHEWESTTKKASNRSWDKVYGVSQDGHLSFYKDQKSFKNQPDATFRGEPKLELHGAAVEIASDYTKKKNVFRVKISNGGEFLLQANDETDLQNWIAFLKQQCDPTATEGKSQTLPATSQKEEGKRRSFFTLKKN